MTMKLPALFLINYNYSLLNMSINSGEFVNNFQVVVFSQQIAISPNKVGCTNHKMFLVIKKYVVKMK